MKLETIIEEIEKKLVELKKSIADCKSGGTLSYIAGQKLAYQEILKKLKNI